jgi:hypothetical protein
MKLSSLNHIDIKHLFKHLMTRKRTLPGVRNPMRDWKHIVIGSALVSVLILALALFLFYGIDKGILFVPANNNAALIPSTIDRNSIDSVGKYYNDREAKLQTLKTAEPTVVDPSR